MSAHQNPAENYPPMSTQADKELKGLRSQIHDTMDPLWLEPRAQRRQRRARLYAWLARELGQENYHTGECGKDQCHRVILLLETKKEELKAYLSAPGWGEGMDKEELQWPTISEADLS